MPRPPIPRFVERVPQITYFKPAGVPLRQLEEVALTVDELEALRLKDLEGLEQEEAAERMGIARTTFRRVLVSARSKIADALVHGKAISIQGGPIAVSYRLVCADCGRELELPCRWEQGGQGFTCHHCGSTRILRAGGHRHRRGRPWPT